MAEIVADRVVAFAPGRANLIGEHTDYSDGLSLPFALEQGVEVTVGPGVEDHLLVEAAGHGTHRFPLVSEPGEPFDDWRDFVRGAVGELTATGARLRPGRVCITTTIPEGAGLSSSAALEVSLCLALLAWAGASPPSDPVVLARLCSRIENEWVGARTGLLDQLAALLATDGHAVLIDFHTLESRPVALELGQWRLIAHDSGEQHSLSESGYNERRDECEQARQRLELESLRQADLESLYRLPEPLGRRVRHVVEENGRVRATVVALERGDLPEVGRLLNASHASLRDLYDASTPAVERTIVRLLDAGAAGARMMGGGFGGSVIALLPPHVPAPEAALPLRPSAGARILEPRD